MGKPVWSPDRLLNGEGGSFLQAAVLSVSDNHATVLLRSSSGSSSARSREPSAEDEAAASTMNSLLKLSVVPTHRDDLTCQSYCTSLKELNAATIDEAVSERILGFLRKLDFRLTSESGAEYSYYTASEKTWWQSPWSSFRQFVAWSPTKDVFKVELISPCTDRQLARSLPTPAMALVEETPALYESIVQPYIEKLVESGSLSWIKNVVDGTKEAERLLLNEETFILNVDTKWRSHPDALTVPREQWFEHKSVEDLYCLAIVKDGSLRSLRDLRGTHAPMLRDILNHGREAIATVYGVPASQLRVFFHYHPQFYHLHIHFTRLENEIGCQIERGHLLSDVIQNLELDSNYYVKRTITYKLNPTSELYMLIQQGL